MKKQLIREMLQRLDEEQLELLNQDPSVSRMFELASDKLRLEKEEIQRLKKLNKMLIGENKELTKMMRRKASIGKDKDKKEN